MFCLLNAVLPYVGRGDDAVTSQLPDVEFVDCQDTVHLTEQLALNVIQLDVGGNGLEEDQS